MELMLGGWLTSSTTTLDMPLGLPPQNNDWSAEPAPLAMEAEDPFDDFDEDDFDDEFDDDFEEDWEDDLTEDEEFPDTFGGHEKEEEKKEEKKKSPFSDDPDFDKK